MNQDEFLFLVALNGKLKITGERINEK